MTTDDYNAALDDEDDAHTEAWRERRATIPGRVDPLRCTTCGRWHIPTTPPTCAHQPECGYLNHETLDCICDELRACEARVRADEREKTAGRVTDVLFRAGFLPNRLLLAPILDAIRGRQR